MASGDPFQTPGQGVEPVVGLLRADLTFLIGWSAREISGNIPKVSRLSFRRGSSGSFLCGGVGKIRDGVQEAAALALAVENPREMDKTLFPQA